MGLQKFPCYISWMGRKFLCFTKFILDYWRSYLSGNERDFLNEWYNRGFSKCYRYFQWLLTWSQSWWWPLPPKKSANNTTTIAQGSKEFSLTPNSRVLVKTNRRPNAGMTKENITKSISCSKRNTFILTLAFKASQLILDCVMPTIKWHDGKIICLAERDH